MELGAVDEVKPADRDDEAHFLCYDFDLIIFGRQFDPNKVFRLEDVGWVG